MSIEQLKIILKSHQIDLIQAVLSSTSHNSACQKITLRPIQTKQGLLYQVSEHIHPKIIHKNISSNEMPDYISQKLEHDFKQAVLYTATNDYHILISQKQKMTILKKKPTKTLEVKPHNRQKSYLLPEREPVDFLVHLGVMTADGKIKAQRADKFRQINRYLEIVNDTLAHLPQTETIRIIDFGCGKSYLTFALYHYLHNIKQLPVEIIGLDLKEDVVSFCQTVSEKLHYKHLSFQVGNIENIKPLGKIHMVISLHACDTATDAALEKAIKWDADIILAVPCCQHELYNQVANDSLSPLLRHGILKERFASLATDAARVQLLELLGYQAQILEFIDMEHTPKNLLIRAIKSKSKNNLQELTQRYLSYKQALQITPSLEKRFKNELAQLFKQNKLDDA